VALAACVPLVALTVAGTACRSESAPAPSASAPRDDRADAAAAEAALREYFAAASAKACDRMTAVAAKAMTPDECAQSLEEIERHDTRFIDVTKWARDGRDPSAMLASTRVTMDGRERVLVLRVERQDGRWKVRL